MSTKNRFQSARALIFCAAAAGGATGCSPASIADPRSPAVAFITDVSDVEAPCSVAGASRVVATGIKPSAGVSAISDDSRVWLRFATRKNATAVLGLDPASLETAAGEAPSARPAAARRGPVVVDLDGHRRLSAWSVGGGRSVVAAISDDRGTVVGAPIELAPDGAVVGRPALAVGPSGRGVLAFIESNGAVFRLVASRIVCDDR